jgi:hypothetical protein
LFSGLAAAGWVQLALPLGQMTSGWGLEQADKPRANPGDEDHFFSHVFHGESLQ